MVSYTGATYIMTGEPGCQRCETSDDNNLIKTYGSSHTITAASKVTTKLKGL